MRYEQLAFIVFATVLVACAGLHQETGEGPGATPDAPEASGPSASPPSAEGPSASPPSAEGPSASPPSVEGPSASPPSAEAPSAGAPSADGPNFDGFDTDDSAVVGDEGEELPATSAGPPGSRAGDGRASPQGGLASGGGLGERGGRADGIDRSGTNSAEGQGAELPEHLRMVNSAAPMLFGDWRASGGGGLSFAPDGRFSAWTSEGAASARHGTWELVRRLPASCVVATTLDGEPSGEMSIDLGDPAQISVSSGSDVATIYRR